MGAKESGRVKWFNNEKGYGFAVNQAGEDVFIHYRSILGDEQYKTLAQGQLISFTQVRSEKGWQAVEVEVLETA